MNASTDIIFFIKMQEGLRLTAYPDGGKFSIGYGVQTYEDGRPVRQGDTITAARAEQLINFHVGKAAGVVNRLVKSRLLQNQFDALVSFVYNVGEGNFASSTLLKVINNNPLDLAEIEKQFKRWIYSQGVVVPALVKRRQEEAYYYGQGAIKKDIGFEWIIVLGVVLYILIKNK